MGKVPGSHSDLYRSASKDVSMENVFSGAVRLEQPTYIDTVERRRNANGG